MATRGVYLGLLLYLDCNSIAFVEEGVFQTSWAPSFCTSMATTSLGSQSSPYAPPPPPTPPRALLPGCSFSCCRTGWRALSLSPMCLPGLCGRNLPGGLWALTHPARPVLRASGHHCERVQLPLLQAAGPSATTPFLLDSSLLFSVAQHMEFVLGPCHTGCPNCLGQLGNFT